MEHREAESSLSLPAVQEERRRRRKGLVQLLGSPLALVGLVILAVFFLVAITATWLPLADPEAVAPLNTLKGPSRGHILGTDEIGRDVLARLIYAGRVSLLIGLGVSIVSVVIGTSLGALAGYFGGWIDSVVMALTNILQSFPLLILVMVIGSIFPLRPAGLVFLVSAVAWVTTARLVRGQVLSLRERQVIEAAKSIGAGHMRLIVFHLVPNALGPVLVAATLLVAFAILTESALSFLGFGVKPPTPTWGNMLNSAQAYIRTAPWLGIFPGLAISLTVLSFNLVGDSLRGRLDPRLRNRP